ncbi:MAG: proline racemase family protein [Sulfolobales archaeon]|nr:proline racemase family protein [Sulfolobales archaeon]MCX8208449.1 proline racemase family protein [Sulfolobales archaeon]MDW8010425.1 proline racemase family protein [Sulfolobales archaeon]
MRVLSFIEVHNAGMPVRIVFAPSVPGSGMVDKKKFCERNLDWIRKLLTYEPRGSGSSYGVLVTSPASGEAQYGALFFDSSGWHDMCGHASMGLVCYLARSGAIDFPDGVAEVSLDTAAGLVRLFVDRGGSVRLVNVPSYVLGSTEVSSPRFGRVPVHLAYGGNLYGVVDLDELGVDWNPSSLLDLVELSKEIWREVGEKARSASPHELYGFRFSKVVTRRPPKYYGILIFGSPERPLLDRSPSGTGSSAHLAYLHHINAVKVRESVEFVSAVNTVFTGRIVGTVTVGGRDAVIPEISTAARGCYLTSYSTVVLEPDDPLGEGFPPLPI